MALSNAERQARHRERQKAELPPDIAAVWTGLDGSGQPAAETARVLIAAWGLETFRTSALHRQALLDLERENKIEAVRTAFIKAKKPKEETHVPSP